MRLRILHILISLLSIHLISGQTTEGIVDSAANDPDLERVYRQMPRPHYTDSATFLPLYPLIYSGFTPDTTLILQEFTPGNAAKSSPLTMPKGWFTEALSRYNTIMQLRQILMTGPMHHVDHFAWQLPVPPELAPLHEAPLTNSEPTHLSLLSSPLTNLPQTAPRQRHWLHNLTTSLQFSQAYISPNWYQGGDNSLTILANFLWNVKLNQVYHPNILLESNLRYKLGLYSTPHDEYHKYAISEDIFQYNLTGGLKALKHWYYSFSLQFKTQILNNYAANSLQRKASFMTPGELNLGLGMTYNNKNKSGTLTFQASIAPLSYNLRTAIDTKIDPTLFNIKAGRHTANEFGSNAELTLTWQLAPNISWRQRMFLFSDYKNFTGDWEHTLNFAINRFLSTQVYIHCRYDTSAPGKEKGWKKWMMKEILSFGFSYNFTTIPPKK